MTPHSAAYRGTCGVRASRAEGIHNASGGGAAVPGGEGSEQKQTWGREDAPAAETPSRDAPVSSSGGCAEAGRTPHQRPEPTSASRPKCTWHITDTHTGTNEPMTTWPRVMSSEKCEASMGTTPSPAHHTPGATALLSPGSSSPNSFRNSGRPPKGPETLEQSRGKSPQALC